VLTVRQAARLVSSGRVRLHVHCGNRLWRKNLRDNNGDGQIGAGDGVDLNRNYSYRRGYDNEGSSPDPSSDTYRGPVPNPEPETKAVNRLFGRIGFEFFIITTPLRNCCFLASVAR